MLSRFAYNKSKIVKIPAYALGFTYLPKNSFFQIRHNMSTATVTDDDAKSKKTSRKDEEIYPIRSNSTDPRWVLGRERLIERRNEMLNEEGYGKEFEYIPIWREFHPGPVVFVSFWFLLTNEYISWNEELLMSVGTLYGLFLGVTYFMENVKENMMNTHQEELKSIQDRIDERIAFYKGNKDKALGLMRYPKIVNECFEHERNLDKKYFFAKSKIKQMERYKSLTKSMDRISAFETDLVVKQRALLADITESEVRNLFEKYSSPALQNAVISSLIDGKDELKKIVMTETKRISEEVRPHIDNFEFEKLPESAQKKFEVEIGNIRRQKAFIGNLVAKLQ